MIIKLASLLDKIKNNRIKMTSEEKKLSGKARILKFSDNGKVKFAVHEQPALIICNSVKEAVKKFEMLRN